MAATTATTNNVKPSVDLPVGKPIEQFPSKGHAPTVLFASSASNPLAGRLDLISPFSFKDRILGFAQKYDISRNYAIGCIVLPLIVGLGLILFGKAAGMALAGKAVLGASAGALTHKLWYFPDPEVFAAISKGNQTSNYAWLKWMLYANQGNTAFFTKQISYPDRAFKATPMEFAIEQNDPIAQAMIEHALKNPSAADAAAAAAKNKKSNQ